MKKAINQEVTKSELLNDQYVICMTTNKQTFNFHFKNIEEAHNEYYEFVMQRSKHNSMVGGKVIIGLYDIYGNKMVCVKQIKIQSIA